MHSSSLLKNYRGEPHTCNFDTFREAHHRETKLKRKQNQENQVLIWGPYWHLPPQQAVAESCCKTALWGATNLDSQGRKMPWQCCKDRTNINDIAKYSSQECHYSKTLSFLAALQALNNGAGGHRAHVCHIKDISQKGMCSLWRPFSCAKKEAHDAQPLLRHCTGRHCKILIFQVQKEPIFYESVYYRGQYKRHLFWTKDGLSATSENAVVTSHKSDAEQFSSVQGTFTYMYAVTQHATETRHKQGWCTGDNVHGTGWVDGYRTCPISSLSDFTDCFTCSFSVTEECCKRSHTHTNTTKKRDPEIWATVC